ncbi:MAG TPA: alpha/beta hydrolase family protein [Anaerolineales bacterium]|nr:alpha/beta hydrolase family protein [Anaerolineales bacterium]
MSVLQYTFESDCLKNNTQITVILPDKPRQLTPAQFYGNGRKYKVLWLLHGTFGDHTDWLRKTNIEMYATERNLVVVMPSALNSNYSNWNDYMLGFKMYDFLTEELMPLIYGWFPVSDRREDNFIAGLSMGGRGTIKFAVNHPEKFAAAAVLSATPMDMSSMGPDNESPFLDTNNERVRTTLANAGGLEAFLNSNEHVWAILDRLAPTGTLPRLMFACGQEDELLFKYYKIFQEHAHEIGLAAHWFELPGYKHEWRFWDLAIQEALDFFGLDERGGNPY